MKGGGVACHSYADPLRTDAGSDDEVWEAVKVAAAEEWGEDKWVVGRIYKGREKWRAV